MQVPSHVEYAKATSVEHALTLLARSGPEARPVAGGHSLLPMMKLRLAQPEMLVDISGLTELSYIRIEGGQLRIGAMTRHAELLASAVAGEQFAILHDAERVIADPIVRNWGTVGGSLCQADPSEDLSAAFAAVRAIAVIRGQGGTREVPIRPGAGSAYEKVERRVGDWSVVAAGAIVWLTGDAVSPSVAGAGIGLTAVGADHFFAGEAEEFLRGQPASEASFRRAGEIAAEHCNPSADQRGPVDYKRHLVAELTARVLGRATARAQGREA
jgi:aerobic carbon-monoxide dehydrogenase medium subunit